MMCMILCVCCMACGKRVPSKVIPPKDMEALLYDYHMATALGYEVSYGENYKKEAYIDYVFRKHGVTEAEFDSSMVWYTRHSDMLSGIYDNLQKRLKTDEDRMKVQVAKRNNQISVSLSGDTVDIWQDRKLYCLTASPLTNKLVFDLKADTTFHPHDAIALEADLMFFPLQRGSATLTMGLSFTFTNDSTMGTVRTLSYAGSQRLFLKADSAFSFRNVSGFMYYEADDNQQVPSGMVLLRDIRLMRYHEQKSSTSLPAVDTLRTIQRDTLRATLHQ